MRRWIGMLLTLGIGAVQPLSASTIYRCVGAAGEVMFADLPCPGGRTQTTQPVVTIALGDLSADERATLERMERERTARVRAEGRVHATRSSAHARAVSQNARRCAATQDGLDRVRAVKRRGYRVASAAALDAREAEFRRKRDRDCSTE